MKTYAQKQSQPATKPSALFGKKSSDPGRTLGTSNDKDVLPKTSGWPDLSRGHDFTLIPTFSKTPVMLQTKLMVNTPGDQYEQEADKVAEQVMRMPEPKANSVNLPLNARPACAPVLQQQAPALVMRQATKAATPEGATREKTESAPHQLPEDAAIDAEYRSMDPL